MKKLLFVLSFVLIALFLTCIPTLVNAETLQDKYNQLATLQAQYNANKNNN